jgi:hypothetical protein
MARVAVLLRANLVASANQLSELLSSKQQALATAAAAASDTSEVLEQLYWLVRMAAHTLADSGVGEVPLPPEAVLMAVGNSGGTAASPKAESVVRSSSADGLQQLHLQQAAAAGAAAVERLSRGLLELTASCLQPAAAAVVSPRLLEACVWGAARWADTYLFPEDEEPLPEPLERAFGGDSGARILDMLVLVVQHCLAAHPGEVELHRQVGGGRGGVGGLSKVRQLLLAAPGAPWQVAQCCDAAAGSCSSATHETYMQMLLGFRVNPDSFGVLTNPLECGKPAPLEATPVVTAAVAPTALHQSCTRAGANQYDAQRMMLTTVAAQQSHSSSHDSSCPCCCGRGGGWVSFEGVVVVCVFRCAKGCCPRWSIASHCAAGCCTFLAGAPWLLLSPAGQPPGEGRGQQRAGRGSESVMCDGL